ncbi:PA14 domain-containing protein [Nocardia stercoris]|nr:PA14 domain-containing protein [Nocardia stercoris]
MRFVRRAARKMRAAMGSLIPAVALVLTLALGFSAAQVVVAPHASAWPSWPWSPHPPKPEPPLLSARADQVNAAKATKADPPRKNVPNLTGVDFRPLGSPGAQTAQPGIHPGGFDPKSSKEASRNESAVEYVNTDGSHSLVLSQHPVSVSDGHGKWVPMDTRIAEDPSSHKARTANEATHAQFAEFANDPALVQVQPNGAPITLALNGAGKAGHKVADSTVTYADALPGQDLKYEVLPGAVKESVIVKSVKSIGDGQWTFTMKLGAGLTPKLDGDQVVVLDAKGQTIAVLPAIQVWDSAGNAKGKTTARTGGKYTLSQAKDGWQLTVSVDKGWLSDKARVFPVTVDPTISSGFGGGTSRTQYTSQNQTYTNWSALDVGNMLTSGDDYVRTAFGFDTSWINGRQVIGARLDFQPWNGGNYPTAYNLNLYASTSPLGYNAEGALLASGPIGNAGSLYSQNLTDYLAARASASINTPQEFMLTGAETPGVNTHMALNANLIIDYGTAPPPAVQASATPADQAVIASTVPRLQVNPVTNPSGDPTLYCFKISTSADGAAGETFDSGCQQNNYYDVPDGVLGNGGQYTWTVQTVLGNGGVTVTQPQWFNHFKIDLRLGAGTTAPTDTLGPATANLYNGNLFTAVSGPKFTSVGGTSGVDLSYNSLAGAAHGVTVSYYNDPTHTGVAASAPVMVRTEPQVNLQQQCSLFSCVLQNVDSYQLAQSNADMYGPALAPALDPNYYIIDYKGYFQAPVDGDYRFIAGYRDGAQVWAGPNHTLVWDDIAGTKSAGDFNTATPYNPAEFDMTLKAGQRIPVEAKLYHRSGNAPMMELSARSVTGPPSARVFNMSPQIVQPQLLYTQDAPVLPAGWNLSVAGSKYVSATNLGSSIVLADSSGGVHTWTQASSNSIDGFTPPANEDGVLAVDTATGIVTETENGTVYTFNPNGTLASVSSVLDSKKPAALQYSYDQSAPTHLTSIKDPVSGQQHTLTYSDGTNSCYNGATGPSTAVAPAKGMLCRIIYWDGTETRLWYSKFRTLDRVENPGNAYTDYTYGVGQGTGCPNQPCYTTKGNIDSNPLIAEHQYEQVGPMMSIRDPLAWDWEATQTNYAPTGPGDTTTFGWNYGSIDNGTTLHPVITSLSSPAVDGYDGLSSRLHQYNYNSGTTQSGVNNSNIPYYLMPGLTTTVSMPLVRGGLPVTVRTVTSDSAGHATSTKDADNVISSQQWTPQDKVAVAIDGAGRESSTVYDHDYRPTDTYGPAPQSCFTGKVPAPVVPTAACASTVPHNHVNYDEGMHGLQASLYSDSNLSGMPAVWQTGIGTADGSLNGAWGATAPVPNATNGWSGRFTGEMLFPAAGQYGLGFTATGGVRLWIDDVKIADNWANPSAPVTGNYQNSNPGTWHRIRVEYSNPAPGNTGALNFTWAPPGSGTTTVPGADLQPRYGMETSRTDFDTSGGSTERAPSGSTTTSYSDPANGIDPVYGLVTAKTNDPGGLNLVRKTTYEAPGTGYLRETAAALPAGDVTDPTKRSTTTYYGDQETRSNPCVSGAPAVNQAGMAKIVTAAKNSDGQVNTAEQVYDQSGRTVASRVDSDGWACTSYDNRGRPTQMSFPAQGAQPARTVTYNYAVGGNPLVSSATDASGTMTTTVDLIGQVTSYTDANGVTTTTSYDLGGRVTSAATTVKGVTSTFATTYDAANRVLTESLDGATLDTPAYDSAGQTTSITYNGNNTSLSSIIRNAAGHTLSTAWQIGGATGSTVTTSVTRSQQGRITDESLTDTSTPGTTYTDSYTFDTVGRLTAAAIPHHQLTYSFSPSGGCGANPSAGMDTNRTGFSDSQNGAAPVTTSYCYDNTDRLTSTSGGTTLPLTYDVYGNATGVGTDTLTYDSTRRHMSTTTAAGTTVTYTRDPADRLIARTTKGTPAPGTDGTTRYGYTAPASAEPQLVLDANNNLLQRVLRLAGGVVLTKTYSPTPAQNWSYPDNHGSVLFTTDGSGNRTGTPVHLYDPFGQDLDPATGNIGDIPVPATMQGGMDLGYLGQNSLPIEHLASEQAIEMGARTYLPVLGRFLQTDPISGGSANNYDYAAADPINNLDLTGKQVEPEIPPYEPEPEPEPGEVPGVIMPGTEVPEMGIDIPQFPDIPEIPQGLMNTGHREGNVYAIIQEGKYDYMFGRVDSNSHNTARSQQNMGQFMSIGIYDTPQGRAYIDQSLMDSLQSNSSIVRAWCDQYGDFEIRDSLLQGPTGGILKLESTWKLLPDGTYVLTTVIPMGRKWA